MSRRFSSRSLVPSNAFSMQPLEDRTFMSAVSIDYATAAHKVRLPNGRVGYGVVVDVSRYDSPPDITVSAGGKLAACKGVNVVITGGVANLTVNLLNKSQAASFWGTRGSCLTVECLGKADTVTVGNLWSKTVINGHAASVNANVGAVDSLEYNGGAGNDTLVTHALQTIAQGNAGKVFNYTVGSEVRHSEVYATDLNGRSFGPLTFTANLTRLASGPADNFVFATGSRNTVIGGQNPFTLGANSSGHQLTLKHARFYPQHG